jgi:hypothetical protein
VENLKTYSGGKFDLSRSCYNLTYEALKAVFYATITLPDPEEITLEEEPWLYNSFAGGRIFTQEAELENGKQLDINSYYPALLQDSKFSFPLTCGVLKTLAQFGGFYEYGIYRCVVRPSGDLVIDRLFTFNKNNLFTHYDLQLAQKLGLKIELICDGEPNFRHYDKRGQGHQYFGKLVHNLYDIKQKMKQAGIKRNMANFLLHRLWGTLCSKNKHHIKDDEVIDLADPEFMDVNPSADTYVLKGSYFKYNYARIGPFLTSMARMKLGEIIIPIKEHVYRVHTDSILLSGDVALPEKIVIGSKLGEWKLEREGSVVIKKRVRPVWA